MMKIFYSILLVGTALVVLRDVLFANGFDVRAMVEPAKFAVLAGAALAAVHAGLAWHERRPSTALQEDLDAGMKNRHAGTLVNMVESAESEPTRFCVSVDSPEEPIEFALRTIGDLRRIRPKALLGQRVEVEWAPNSGTVLHLRSAAEAQARPLTGIRGIPS